MKQCYKKKRQETFIHSIPFVFLFCFLPILLPAQWRSFSTTKYQQQVEALNTLDHPAITLELPANLPLVFHIVYAKDSEPITRAAIDWQVAQLNKHFSLEEFEEKKTIFQDATYHHLAADTEIQFCLQSVVFVATDSLEFADFNTIKEDTTGGSKPIDPEKNINIWVGELTTSSGFAQMPGGVLQTDGIVIDQDYFGNQAAPYGEGKTLTHLIGNYLGLQDLWGNNKCEDDEVNDTPVHNAPNYNSISAAENHITLCEGFEREMYMNYMDNTVDSMLYMFTEGQKERMHQMLANERNHLLAGECVGAEQEATFRTNLQTEKQPMGLKISPNPVQDLLRINYRDQTNTSAVLEIHNSLGALIHREKIGQSYQQSLSTHGWTAGIYIISIKGKHPYSQKIIKQ